MDAQPDVEKLRNSDVFSPKSDEIAAGGDELFDANHVVEGESDGDDYELLNLSRLFERCSGNPGISGSHAEPDRLLPFDYRLSPSDMTEQPSRSGVDVGARTSILAWRSESNKLAAIEKVELKYTLYAVVVHVGLTSSSGHYYCFIRLSPDVWCKFDDSRVVQVHEDFVTYRKPTFSSMPKREPPGFQPSWKLRRS